VGLQGQTKGENVNNIAYLIAVMYAEAAGKDCKAAERIGDLMYEHIKSQRKNAFTIECIWIGKLACGSERVVVWFSLRGCSSI
jgi:hypothetical protein